MDDPTTSEPATNPTRFRRWADLCTTDFAGLNPERTVAILPLGATEQHGPHLPLSVDTDLLEGILLETGQHLSPDLPVYLLPSLAVGYSPEHQAFAGTLTLRPETTLQLWSDIAESVARAGVRKLVLFNTHGGHTGMMDVVGRQLRSRFGLMVYSVSWFNLPLLDDVGADLNTQISAQEHRFGIHGGQVETSMMLALRPDRVRLTRAEQFHSTSEARAAQYPVLGNGRSAKLSWMAQDYHPGGAVGNAALANQQLGQQLISAAGRAFASLLSEVVALPLSTLRD
ncbi:MAG: hypothetical protein RL323_1422 [Pseudomonadota bacterium]|jgi:creatinine amidohydrolase